MHIHCGYTVILIGGVIIYARIRIAAAGINSYLVLAVFKSVCAARLFYTAQNMKELVYAFLLRAALTNLDCDDKSPGSPIAPSPFVYSCKFSLSEKLFWGCSADKPI